MTRLRAWFAGRAAADIRAEEIDARLSELARAGRAPATVNQYRALLSLTFSLAVRSGKVPGNPLRRVPVRRTNHARVRFLTLPEEAALRQAIRRFCPLREPELDLALHTGMRRGEQYTLRWQDVDLERALVCGPRGRRWFDRAIREAGIRDFRYHDLRHTFASRLVMAGVDLRTVQELMGHKTLLMTLRYSHLSQAHTREAIEKLARAAQPPAATGTATGASIDSRPPQPSVTTIP
jgi:integrase